MKNVKNMYIFIKLGGGYINRRVFVQSCASTTGLTQVQVNKVLEYCIDYIKCNLLNGDEAAIPGIGKIIPTERKINKHIHPITNQYYEDNKYKTIRMKMFPSFKEILNSENNI